MTSKPNVILLIFDSLRADLLSCYCEGGVESESFNEVAKNGVLFEEAYAVGPGTPISHAGLFSGQYPSTSGVDKQTNIPKDIPWISDHFKKNGYETYGIPGPARMGSSWDYDRGYDSYYEIYKDSHPDYYSPIDLMQHLFTNENRSLIINDLFRAITTGDDSYCRFKLDLIKKEVETNLSEPFFMMMNTGIAHTPWVPPRPYMKQETPEINRPRLNLFEFLLERIFDRYPSIDKDNVRTERVFEVQKGGKAKVLNDPSYLNEHEVELLWKWYESCMTYLDKQLKEFLSWFSNSGLSDNTILIQTSDHGEHFGEKDLWTHSYGLFEECLRVPLVMMGPGVPKGERVSGLVSLVDIFDTICDLSGVSRSGGTDGISLFSDDSRDAVFAEYAPKQGGHLSNFEGAKEERLYELSLGRKGIRTNEFFYEYRSDGSDQLYTRPGEKPVKDPDPETVETLKNKLAEELGLVFDSHEENPFLGVSDSVERNLKELGYL